MNRRARTLWFGLFSLLWASCAPRDPHEIAKAADAAAGGGLYTWLADHDPSALVVVDVDLNTVRLVAPDARAAVAQSVADGCRLARARHALLAVHAAKRTAPRDLAEDCGVRIYHDDLTTVVVPR